MADRVLSTLFERHVGDSGAFARALYLSASQVREMARGGMTFGFHTRSHPVLSRLDHNEQRQELHAGPALIGDLTGQDTVSFCYPYGFPHTYNADTLHVLEEYGYSMAFNTVRCQALIGREPRYELRGSTRAMSRVSTRCLPVRNVCVVIGSRANYGSIKSVMRAVEAHPELRLQIIVGASALLDRFGSVVEVIERDGFIPDARVNMIVEGETPVTMAKSTGLGLLELPTLFELLKPDVVVTVGDRFETMATAVAALI